MKLIFACLCFFVLLGVQAQERYNFLAVNSTLLESEAGPFYFTKQGNNKDSYARADLLAQALGVSFSLEDDYMRFESQGSVITLKTTTDIMTGLNKHPNVLIANNQAYESPMGIIVDGRPYVAITPITKALGGQSGWQASDELVWVHYTPPAPQAATPPITQAQPIASPGNVLAAPRHGLQKEGHTRIVLDLPPGTFYELLADANHFIVKLPTLTASGFNQPLDKDPNLESFRYGLIDNTLALIVTTRYTLNAQGSGYRFLLLAPTPDIPHERLVIEFSSSFQGSQAIQLAQGFTVQDLPAQVRTTAAHPPTGHQKVVVIDAGHGGKDSGAASRYAIEKDVVLAVSLKLKALLEAQGIQVTLTRDSDYFIELEDRADYATTDINLFVSIHANAVKAAEARGVETWVFGQPLEPALLALAKEENGGNTAAGEARTQEALQVAEGILGDVMLESQLSYSLGLAQLVQDEIIAATSAKDRGVRKNAFYVLRKARSPSILIELGFISNPEEGSLLATDSYQNIMAQAIANGIISFFNHGGIVASVSR